MKPEPASSVSSDQQSVVKRELQLSDRDTNSSFLQLEQPFPFYEQVSTPVQNFHLALTRNENKKLNLSESKSSISLI